MGRHPIPVSLRHRPAQPHQEPQHPLLRETHRLRRIRPRHGLHLHHVLRPKHRREHTALRKDTVGYIHRPLDVHVHVHRCLRRLRRMGLAQPPPAVQHKFRKGGPGDSHGRISHRCRMQVFMKWFFVDTAIGEVSGE